MFCQRFRTVRHGNPRQRCNGKIIIENHIRERREQCVVNGKETVRHVRTQTITTVTETRGINKELGGKKPLGRLYGGEGTTVSVIKVNVD